MPSVLFRFPPRQQGGSCLGHAPESSDAFSAQKSLTKTRFPSLRGVYRCLETGTPGIISPERGGAAARSNTGFGSGAGF